MNLGDAVAHLAINVAGVHRELTELRQTVMHLTQNVMQFQAAYGALTEELERQGILKGSSQPPTEDA